MRRLRVGVLGIAFVLSLFAGRLVQLQGMEYGKYRAIAQRERLHDLPIPAVRGSIEGADGSPLAMTVDADLVYADPTQMVGVTPAQTEARAQPVRERACRAARDAGQRHPGQTRPPHVT